jgi:broad specificity phosphatase PhoE
MIAFVRHGQTAANRAGLFQGRVNTPLTALGRDQAGKVARLLAASDAPVRVFSSPLDRARTTAEAIASATGVGVEVDDRLVEVDYGEWDELALGDVPVDAWRHWRDTPSFAPPGGESLEAVTERVVDFCTAREHEWRNDLIVAVSHVSPIKAAVCWALGVGTPVSWRMQLGLASITRIAAGRDGGPALFSFNETAHLTQ